MIINTKYRIKNSKEYNIIHFETSAKQVVTDKDNRFVSEAEKAKWNNLSGDIVNLKGMVANKADNTHNHDSVYMKKGEPMETAKRLAKAVNINNTPFDGSASITTNTWGQQRKITIGNSSKNVDGSTNMSWSLSEIGAAERDHYHSNYISTTQSDVNFSGNVSARTITTKNNAGYRGMKSDGSPLDLLYVSTSNEICIGYQGAAKILLDSQTRTKGNFTFDNSDIIFKRNGNKTARLALYNNPDRVELFWSQSVDGEDWTYSNKIYFTHDGIVSARNFFVNGQRISTEGTNNMLFLRQDGAEYSELTCKGVHFGPYSGATNKLSLGGSAPSSPKTGDVWIQI